MRQAITYTTKQLPGGERGTLATLKLMAKLVKKYSKHPLIYKLSRRLVSRLPSKNYAAEAKTLHAFVRDKIRYCKDIDGVETVMSPDQTLVNGCGDCDDQSVLIASLLKSIGHPVRFVVVGNTKGHFSHVYVETKIGSKWAAVETTEPWGFGQVHRKSNHRKIHYIQ